jgi:hypothetical protein
MATFSSCPEPSGPYALDGECDGRSQFINAQHVDNENHSIVLGAYSRGEPGYIEVRVIESGAVHSHDLALPAGGATIVRADGIETPEISFEVTSSVPAYWVAWNDGF